MWLQTFVLEWTHLISCSVWARLLGSRTCSHPALCGRLWTSLDSSLNPISAASGPSHFQNCCLFILIEYIFLTFFPPSFIANCCNKNHIFLFSDSLPLGYWRGAKRGEGFGCQIHLYWPYCGSRRRFLAFTPRIAVWLRGR